MTNLVKILFTAVSFFIYFMVFEFILEFFLPVSSSIEFVIGALLVVVASFVLSLFSSNKLMDVLEG